MNLLRFINVRLEKQIKPSDDRHIVALPTSQGLFAYDPKPIEDRICDSIFERLTLQQIHSPDPDDFPFSPEYQQAQEWAAFFGG